MPIFSATLRTETVGNARLPNVVAMIFNPNATNLLTETLWNGAIHSPVESPDEPHTVFFAKHGYHSHTVEGWVPADGELKVALREYPEGGSGIIAYMPTDTAEIPGLEGSWRAERNPTAVNEDELFILRTTGLQINGGDPARFVLGLKQVVELTDVHRKRLSMSIGAIQQNSIVYEYWPVLPVRHSHEERRDDGVAGGIN